ncbi:cytochrome P450 [Kitasatospora sp. NPDC059327]|uniref:cytochrome P450 n=1 Tax=Kitasatospora sp. NPDC059327 TaxID=3346803 RepID=UPI0036C07963
MSLYTNTHPFTTGIDISSAEFWNQSFEARDTAFSRLRREAPVSWHPPIAYAQEHSQEGFWAVTRVEDITTVSMNSEVFQSRHGIQMEPLDPELARTGSFFLAMDAPQHSRYRGLVSAAFTPKRIKGIEDRIKANAARIVDDLVGAGAIDFVADCSSKLPMETVSDIVGVPQSERAQVARAAENVVGGADAAGLSDDQALIIKFEAFTYLRTLGADLAAHRRRSPADDLLTNLVQARIDGEGLTDDDIGDFMVLMGVAGNDTTKQTTTRTMLSLATLPDQRDWLMADFDARIMPAIDEFVRHASPVMQFARTAAEDVELAGSRISAGDKVVMFYCSGNRDESKFPDPHAFDLSRPASPHVGFGGGGAHFCLGNGVAKVQLRSIIGELLHRLPNIEFGEPEPLRSKFINGIDALPAYVR